jgi:hypothetical protein
MERSLIIRIKCMMKLGKIRITKRTKISINRKTQGLDITGICERASIIQSFSKTLTNYLKKRKSKERVTLLHYFNNVNM